MIPSLLSYLLLALTIVGLWLPRWRGVPLWIVPFTLSLLFALWLGQVTASGLMAIAAMLVLAQTARTASGWQQGLSLLLLAVVALLLGAHRLPGFEPTLLIAEQVVKPGSLPYEKWIGFDKAVVVVALLGIYAPRRGITTWRVVMGATWLGITTATVVVVMGLALLAGRIELVVAPLPLPLLFAWATSNLLVTVMAEEALFRGVIQRALMARYGVRGVGGVAAVVLPASLFGLAHIGGGWEYVALATVAGAGYGAIYLLTRRLEGAIAAHFLLNSTHLLLFSYPGLG